jgi:hypothetical protein
MRPRDLFGVAVRVLGVWFLSQNLYWFLWAAIKSNDVSFGNQHVPPHENIAYGIIYFVLGVLLLLCADPIVWIVYGWPPKPSGDKISEDQTSQRE